MICGNFPRSINHSTAQSGDGRSAHFSFNRVRSIVEISVVSHIRWPANICIDCSVYPFYVRAASRLTGAKGGVDGGTVR